MPGLRLKYHLLEVLYYMGIMRKKICMLGTFAVGKTSLVARYVHGIFSEKYLTTIGVKIDKKSIPHEKRPIELILWDLNGIPVFRIST